MDSEAYRGSLWASVFTRGDAEILCLINRITGPLGAYRHAQTYYRAAVHVRRTIDGKLQPVTERDHGFPRLGQAKAWAEQTLNGADGILALN